MPRLARNPGAVLRRCALPFLLGAVCWLLPASPASADPVAAGPAVLDASGQIAQPSGLAMSIARDGTGGLVYLRRDAAGVRHVFLSRLLGGVFGTPQQLDAGLAGDSTQPAVGAGANGLLLIAFVNAGALYTVTVRDRAAAVPAPVRLIGGAASPAISVNLFSKALLVFTVPDGSGTDVRAAYSHNGPWAVAASAFNVTPGDDAGSGTGAPRVALAGDGTGVVVWGEGGHVFSRRIVATTLSSVTEQADTAPAGCSENSADEPAVGIEGDSSYADVAFRESVSCGGAAARARVFARRLRASAYEDLRAVDGQGTSSGGDAGAPAVVEGEYGRGLITAEQGFDILATPLGNDGSLGRPGPVNSSPQLAEPFAVPGLAGLSSSFVAWQGVSSDGAAPEIRARFAQNGVAFGPETVLSSAGSGPADAADGLVAGGDINGDGAVAWLQGAGPGSALVTAELLQPPGSPAPLSATAYSSTVQPTLSWTAAPEPWGPVTYQVSVDGAGVGQTTSTSLLVPAPLAEGSHTWQVTAVNSVGETGASPPAVVWVDTIPPQVALSVDGTPRPGRVLRFTVTAADPPPSGNPAAASGIAGVHLDLGDGTMLDGATAAQHAYARPGSYRVRAIASDRAGNTAEADFTVRVPKPPRPRPRHRRRRQRSGAPAPHRPSGRRSR